LEVLMKRFAFFVAGLVFLVGCGLPQETLRGVGNEGFLQIIATPEDAEVLVDGQPMGPASRFEKNPLELQSGTHKVEIRKAGYLSEVRDVYVANQSRHSLKVTLRKSP